MSGENKEDVEVGGDVSEAAETSPTVDADDYPAGATLALIVVALAMSMFLVALDMVTQNKQFEKTLSLAFAQFGIVWLTFAPNSF